jgi:hypothetical protein
MTEVYLVMEHVPCDDTYYDGATYAIAAYAVEQSAKDAVAAYEKECEGEYNALYAGNAFELWEIYPSRYVTSLPINQL